MGRKRGITQEDVLDAAVIEADVEGWDALSLVGVARRLGIQSPSLYAHVQGLDGLRRGLALRGGQRMADALREACSGHHGLASLRTLCLRYRAFAQENPGLYAAVQRAVRPGEDDELYRVLGAAVTPVVVALAEANVPPGERMHLARALRSALHGFVELERGGGFGRPESVEESFQRLVDLLMAGVNGVANATAREQGDP